MRGFRDIIVIAGLIWLTVSISCSTKNDPPAPKHGAPSNPSTSATSTTTSGGSTTPVPYSITVNNIENDAEGGCQDTGTYRIIYGLDTTTTTFCAVTFDKGTGLSSGNFSIGLAPSGNTVSLDMLIGPSQDEYKASSGTVKLVVAGAKHTVQFDAVHVQKHGDPTVTRTVSGYFGCN